ncbi:DUF2066 domain-containing protein [Terricaulis sp.]|uniref:DUF2066 domain-containing protein n=1 Tax=Terricaulis sp. TaxID=2768686 RepID=UPI0037839F29
MKATPLAAFAAFIAAALCAFAPGAASAQSSNVYVVAGISVDVTAANAAAGQQAGFVAAQQQGFERLVRRVTPAAELAGRQLPQLDPASLEHMVNSVDVEEERRSATRYIGRLTVRFDANQVRAFLRQQGLTVVDARTAPVLIAPLVLQGTATETAALWRDVWMDGGYQEELVPLAVAPDGLQGAPSWQAAAPFATAAAATSALYATLRVQGSTVTAALVEVNVNGQTRDRGEVTARVNGGDAASLRAALSSLATQASDQLQNEWKARVPVASGTRNRVPASALYASMAEWQQIKGGLEAAARTLISEIRIEAVGRDGALVSFTYVGEPAQLQAELARNGVTLQQTSSGPVLRAAPRRQ